MAIIIWLKILLSNNKTNITNIKKTMDIKIGLLVHTLERGLARVVNFTIKKTSSIC